MFATNKMHLLLTQTPVPSFTVISVFLRHQSYVRDYLFYTDMYMWLIAVIVFNKRSQRSVQSLWLWSGSHSWETVTLFCLSREKDYCS